jgi:hypothetical protein
VVSCAVFLEFLRWFSFFEVCWFLFFFFFFGLVRDFFVVVMAAELFV